MKQEYNPEGLSTTERSKKRSKKVMELLQEMYKAGVFTNLKKPKPTRIPAPEKRKSLIKRNK